MHYVKTGALVWLLCCCSFATADPLLFIKQNSEPKFLPDGTGLCDQIYQSLADDLATQGVETEVLAENYPIKRILKMLETGQASAFCGAGLNDERKALFHYSSIPSYHISNVILAHRDETVVPASFDDIVKQELIIGAFFGTTSAQWLASHDGVIVDANYHTLDEVVESIAQANGGLRYFYYHDLGLNHYVATRGLPVKVLPAKYRTIPQWIIYSKTLPPEMVSKLEQSLTRLQESGKLRAIQQQFLTD